MRPIDADYFIKELEERLLPVLIKKYGENEAKRGLHFSFNDVIANIKSQPTAVRIIRCKECKYSYFYDHPTTAEQEWVCTYWMHTISSMNGFCHMAVKGESKE